MELFYIGYIFSTNKIQNLSDWYKHLGIEWSLRAVALRACLSSAFIFTNKGSDQISLLAEALFLVFADRSKHREIKRASASRG